LACGMLGRLMQVTSQSVGPVSRVSLGCIVLA